MLMKDRRRAVILTPTAKPHLPQQLPPKAATKADEPSLAELQALEAEEDQLATEACDGTEATIIIDTKPVLGLTRELEQMLSGMSQKQIESFLSSTGVTAKKTKGKQHKEEEPEPELPQMHLVDAIYTCNLCGTPEIKAYKCNKAEPAITDVETNWCKHCESALLEQFEADKSTAEPLISRLVAEVKKNCKYIHRYQ